jgi:hypothetical protein
MEGEGMKFYADGKKSQGKFENSVENGWIKQVTYDFTQPFIYILLLLLFSI